MKIACQQKGVCTLLGRAGPLSTSKEYNQTFYELCIRSSSMREGLKEKLKETSIEGLLRQVRDYTLLHTWSPEDLQRMSQSGGLNSPHNIETMTASFTEWYMRMRAPQCVEMHEPWGWYPKARSMRRRVIFHAGPTNSGKTHAALQRLITAKSGVYCAPLKALAAQVWSQVNQHVPCDLMIGDERVFAGYAEHVSCTVEMTPVDEVVDVGVIDEVQLIGDRDRGWAWTRALLGLPARELHVCGEFRALQLVEKLLYATREWDHMEIVTHKRLVPLRIESQPMSPNLQGLDRGDCLVVFSRKDVFFMKQRVEKQYPNAVVNIIYGGLPFDVRQAQCDQYNEGVQRGNFHVLVTTDAIAYGLNMNIRRIILTTLRKFDGKGNVDLSDSQILQIAGRAGRFGMAFDQAGGYVTSFHKNDNEKIERAFATKLPPVKAAGLLPTVDILTMFSMVRPHLTQLLPLLEEFWNVSTTSKDLFFVCDITRSLLPLARALDTVVGMTLADKIIFSFVPLNDGGKGNQASEMVVAWARGHCNKDGATLGDALLHVTHGDARPSLQELEWKYRMLEAYCWLAWRFPRTFRDLEVAKKRKAEVVEAMKRALGAAQAPVHVGQHQHRHQNQSKTSSGGHEHELRELCLQDIQQLLTENKARAVQA